MEPILLIRKKGQFTLFPEWDMAEVNDFQDKPEQVGNPKHACACIGCEKIHFFLTRAI